MSQQTFNEDERQKAALAGFAITELHAKARLHRAKTFAFRALGVGAVVFAFGCSVSAVLWTWGHHLPPPMIVQAPVYISPPRMFSEEASKAKVSFTVFFTMPGAPGSEVVTGHNYKSTEDSEPTDSYCYAGFPKSDGSTVTVNLGKNGKAELPAKNPAPPPFNLLPLSVAFQACHWPEKKS